MLIWRRLKKQKYMLLSGYREEDIDVEQNILYLFHFINALAANFDMSILNFCHLHSKKH